MHKSGTVLFTTKDKFTALNRAQHGWRVEEMTSREQFEQAIKARFGDSIDYRVCKNSDGEYMAWDMQVAWWAWQAAFTAANATIHNLELQLADAEARGVDKFATEIGSVHKQLRPGSNHAHALKSVVFRAVEFAAQLRQGAKS